MNNYTGPTGRTDQIRVGVANYPRPIGTYTAEHRKTQGKPTPPQVAVPNE
jgi:hypothetical protein